MAQQAKTTKTATIPLTTVCIPSPIKKFTSRDNFIATNNGEIYAPFDVLFEHWTDKELAKFSETELLTMLNQEFCEELSTGFVFKTELEAGLFVVTMAKLVRG